MKQNNLGKLLCRKSRYSNYLKVLFAVIIYFSGMNSVFAGESTSFRNESSQQNATIDVKGKITDESGSAVPGATVVVVGKGNVGAISDVDGNYELKGISPNAELLVSFIGFQKQQVKVAGRTIVNFQLKADVQQIDEVVVQVGYGSVKRANLLGAVSDIKADKVEDVVTGNMSTALRGTLPGVIIGQASGAPGASTSITVRIPGSWNAEPPLFVIDGFVRDQSAFDVLDPSEIESVSVLKDASAAVYGVRSAGGVILVTTKHGKEGRLKVNYSGTVGISDATATPQLMSAYDQAVALNDYTRGYYNWDDNLVLAGAKNEGQTYFSDSELEQMKNLDYNWLDYGWKAATQTRHNISISGGSEKVRYFVGGSYLYQNGNFKNLNLNKYTMRMNIDIDLAEDWILSMGLNGDYRKTNSPYNDADKEPEKMYNTYSTLLRTPRWLPPYINGLPVGQEIVSNHPLYINTIDSYRKSESSNTTANMALKWKVPYVKGLNAKLSFDYSKGNSAGLTIAKPYYLYNFKTVETDYSSGYLPTQEVASTTRVKNGDKYQQSSSSGSQYQLNFSLQYDRQFGKHNINAMAIFEQSENQGLSLTGYVENMIIDNVEKSSAWGDGVSPVLSGSPRVPSGNLSYIGRFNYNYDERYLLESTFRYEASNKFAPGNRWGLFPSISVGWRISEENFFKDNVNPNFMDNLKLRFSYGVLGNDKANALSWEENYRYSEAIAYLGGSTLLGGIDPNNNGIALSGVSWEKAKAYNLGLDTRFLRNISFSLNAFYRHNFDILQKRASAISYTAGITTEMPAENYGIQDSWGGEINMSYNGKVGAEFGYHVSGNLSYATSKVIRKYQAAGVIGTWKDEIGRIRGGETGYYATGILQQADVDKILAENPDYTIFGYTPEAGMLNYKDIGGPDYSNEPDGKIDEWDERIISKYDSPPYNYGLSIGCEWKGLKFDATFSGQFGNKVVYDKAVYNKGAGNRQTFDWLSSSSNNLEMWNDHWTPENTDASLPALYNGMGNYRSTFWMRDGHILKLTTATLSYNLPKSLVSVVGLPGARIYFSGTNLLTIINPFPYRDPNLSSWMDYPIMRSFNLGINLNL